MSQSPEIKGPKDNWPHKFVKDGKEELFHPRGADGQEHVEDYIKVVPYICIHCHVKYTLGKDAIPPGPCPARTDKQELKRLHAR